MGYPVGDQQPSDLGALITLSVSPAGTYNSPDMSGKGASGVKVVTNITAQGGVAPTLQVNLQGKDQASGLYYNLLSSVALAALGLTVLTLFPGAPVSANAVASDMLPEIWRVQAIVAGTT